MCFLRYVEIREEKGKKRCAVGAVSWKQKEEGMGSEGEKGEILLHLVAEYTSCRADVSQMFEGWINELLSTHDLKSILDRPCCPGKDCVC